jgi:hypothetical protein
LRFKDRASQSMALMNGFTIIAVFRGEAPRQALKPWLSRATFAKNGGGWYQETGCADERNAA